MKKITIILMCIVLLFNFISVTSFAEEPAVTTPPVQEEKPVIPSEEDVNKKEPPTLDGMKDEFGVTEDLNAITTEIDNGKTNVKNDNGKDISLSTTGTTFSNPFTFKVLVKVLAVIPQVANQLMEVVVEQAGNEKISKFTIYDTVMGKYELFNIDFIDVPDKPEGCLGYEIIRYNIVSIYSLLRNASIAISLFVLIYIGIRMATSTVASQKAKYNKMLLNWFVSLFLVFIMHFIVIIISYILRYGLNIVNTLANAMNIDDIETNIYNVAMQSISGGAIASTGVTTPVVKGWNSAVALITIWIIVYYEVRFFVMYIHRMFEVGFLVAIGPIVTITYSIDKAGDNKAQAFSAWFSELILKASVQIVHAVTYCVFIASAGVIAQNHPLLAAIFLALLVRVEKIVRNTLTLKDDSFQRVKVPFMHRHK